MCLLCLAQLDERSGVKHAVDFRYGVIEATFSNPEQILLIAQPHELGLQTFKSSMQVAYGVQIAVRAWQWSLAHGLGKKTR